MEVTNEKGVFSVSYQGRVIFKHSGELPALALGNAKDIYHNQKGRFRVSECDRLMEPCQKLNIISQNTDRIEINFDGNITLVFEKRGSLLYIVPKVTGNFNRLEWMMPAEPTEKIFGGGLQYSELNLKGKRMPIWRAEKGVGRAHDPISLFANMAGHDVGNWCSTPCPHPSFISSQHYFLYVQIDSWMALDFTSQDEHGLDCWAIPEYLVYGSACSLMEAVKKLNLFLGCAAHIPTWALEGIWLGLDCDFDLIHNKLLATSQANIPVSALYCANWLDTTLNLKIYLKKLSEDNIHFLGYFSPVIKINAPLYAEASKKDLLIKAQNGYEYQVKNQGKLSGLLDFSHPKTKEWLTHIITHEMLDIGMDGWLVDCGGFLSAEAILYSNRNSAHYHNQYTVDWAKFNKDMMVSYLTQKSSGDRDLATSCSDQTPILLSQTGGRDQSQVTEVFYTGHQLTNWSWNDGFPSVIPASLSLGLCGFGLSYSDIGGYTSLGWIRRTKELFMRWCEYAAFTPIMYVSQGSHPKKNWQFDSDEETTYLLKKMVQVHLALKPYFLHFIKCYQDTGTPLIRMLALHFEKDSMASAINYQFMLGDSLLVAPVLEPKKKKWKVYLPQERWRHLFTGDEFLGGWHQIDVPLGCPPVFYLESSAFKNLFEKLRL